MKFSAQTAEQAIEKGLQELGKTREEVEIVIVSEGKKGFLGIFGGKPAEVEITPKETERVEEKAETVAEPEPSDEKKGAESEQEVEQALRKVGSYLAEVTKEMGVETKIEVTVERRDVFYNFSTDNLLFFCKLELPYKVECVNNRHFAEIGNVKSADCYCKAFG